MKNNSAAHIQFVNTPVMIEPNWGFNYLSDYLANSDLGYEAVKQLREDAKELLKPSFFSASEKDPIQLNVSRPESINQPVVAEFRLIGPMMKRGGLCTDGSDVLAGQLTAAANNPNIVGVVLHTDSGGGQVTAAQEIGLAIAHLRENKPVVQMVNGFSASGAYFVGCQCDEVLSLGNLSRIGSIGVVAQFDVISLKILKDYVISVYSKGSEEKHQRVKDILAGNAKAFRKRELDPVKVEFDRLVKSNRPGLKEKALDEDGFIRALMYDAVEAKKLGLIDSIINTKEEAIQRVLFLDRRRKREQRKQIVSTKAKNYVG